MVGIEHAAFRAAESVCQYLGYQSLETRKFETHLSLSNSHKIFLLNSWPLCGKYETKSLNPKFQFYLNFNYVLCFTHCVGCVTGTGQNRALV
jgi:hypothetical protein